MPYIRRLTLAAVVFGSVVLVGWNYKSLVYLRSSLTMFSYPFRAAYNSGVSPKRSSELTLTSFRFRSSLTTLSCPFSAAYESGVRPRTSFKSALIVVLRWSWASWCSEIDSSRSSSYPDCSNLICSEFARLLRETDRFG